MRLRQRQVTDFAAIAHGATQGVVPVGQATGARGAGTPRGQRTDRDLDLGDHFFGRRHFGCRHLFKIQILERFLRRERHRGVDLDLGPFSFAPLWQVALGTVQKRLGCAAFGCTRRTFFLHTPHQWRQNGHHMFQKLRITPVQAEDLRKHQPVLGARDETGVQGPVEIGFASETGGLDRADGVGNSSGAGWQTGFAQGAGEMGDVGDKIAVLRDRKIVYGIHQAEISALAFASFRMRAASEPEILAMSS